MTPNALHGSMLPLRTSLTMGQPALRRVSKPRASTTTTTRVVALGGGDRSKSSSFSSSSSSLRRVECEVVRGKGLPEEEHAAASAAMQGRRVLLASGLTLLAMAPTTANATVDSAAPLSYGGPRPDESTSELMGEMAKLLKASREADESGQGGGDKESGLRNLGLLAIVGLVLIPLVKVVLGGGLALSTLKYLQKEKRDQKCVCFSLGQMDVVVAVAVSLRSARVRPSQRLVQRPAETSNPASGRAVEPAPPVVVVSSQERPGRLGGKIGFMGAIQRPKLCPTPRCHHAASHTIESLNSHALSP
jgi:hypothetical protein